MESAVSKFERLTSGTEAPLSRPVRPRRAVDEDPTIPFFWWCLGAHCVVWILVPLLSQPSLPMDAVEMIYWGQEWQLGYYKHPPLPAWIAALVSMLTANSEGSLYVISQLFNAVTLWAVWTFARKFLHPWTALCATFALEACYYITFTTPEFNNNVVSRCLWALAILYGFRALETMRKRHWAIVSVCLGLGLLSKYDTVLLIAALFGFSIWNDRARQCWETSRPFMAFGIIAAIISPHVVWLWQHDFPTVSYVLTRSEGSGALADHVMEPVHFALSQLLAVVPVLILLIPLSKSFTDFWLATFALDAESTKRSPSLPHPDREFARDYLVWTIIIPFALLLVSSALLGIRLRSMWGSALWSYVGVAALLCSELAETKVQWRRVILWSGVCGLAFAVGLAAHDTVLPRFRHQASRIHFPSRQAAALVRQAWKESYGDQRLEVVGGPWWLAANIGVYLPQRASVYADLDPSKSPWMNDSQLLQNGGAIVWDMDSETAYTIEGLYERFGLLQFLDPIVLDWDVDADVKPIRLGVALVPPRAPVEVAQVELR